MTNAWKIGEFNVISLSGYWPKIGNAHLGININDEKNAINDGLRNPDGCAAYFKFGIYHNDDAELFETWKKWNGKCWPEREAHYRDFDIEIGGNKKPLGLTDFEVKCDET